MSINCVCPLTWLSLPLVILNPHPWCKLDGFSSPHRLPLIFTPPSSELIYGFPSFQLHVYKIITSGAYNHYLRHRFFFSQKTCNKHLELINDKNTCNFCTLSLNSINPAHMTLRHAKLFWKPNHSCVPTYLGAHWLNHLSVIFQGVATSQQLSDCIQMTITELHSELFCTTMFV